MEINDQRVKKLADLYGESNIRRFLSVVTDYLNEFSVYPGLKDEVENVRSNYERMVQCYRQGMPDPQREDIYTDFEEFMYKTMMNLVMHDHVMSNATLKAAKKRAEKIDLSTLEETLADHQGDVEYYNAVFSAILISWQWDVSLSASITDLILSPRTDHNLAAMMVSAIMLSCLCTFDFYKFVSLTQLYQNADDMMIKERAFVGWVFCSCNPTGQCVQLVSDVLLELLDDEGTINEVYELQKQMFYCMDAGKDSSVVHEAILSNIPTDKLTRGFSKDSEIEETPLNDILHPEQEEEQVEKLEKSVRRMIKMEKNGSDVYFGGFSKMKTFGFFHSMSNWFVPFYHDNPALQPVLRVLDGEDTFLKTLETSSPFCESDKYSFAFAIEMSLKSELASLKPLIKEGVLFADMARDGMEGATFVRRMYLQDLYRFFLVSPFASAFDDPFSGEENGPSYFLHCWDFDDDTVLRETILKLCRSLAKRKDYKRLGIFAPKLAGQDTTEGVLLYAIYLMNYSHAYHEAAMLLAMLSFTSQEENAAVLKALAKCFVELKLYDGAYETYSKLQTLKPSESTRLKMAFCLIKRNKPEEAMKILYELNYKYPDNADVIRSLAWAHLLNDNLDGAIEFYAKLKMMTEEEGCQRTPEDVYNLGLCYWVKRDFSQACGCFKEYLATKGDKDEDLFEKIDEDSKLLEKYGIKYYELYLMRDSVETE